MRRRKRVRKKVHRIYLDYVIGDVGSNSEWHDRLMASEPGQAFFIAEGPTRFSNRRMKRWSLRYWVSIAKRIDNSICVVRYWADEFPDVDKYAVIFDYED